jgi:hypothetical protein
MWTYDQSSGAISHNGVPFANGYSGKGFHPSQGRNNPDLEHVPNVGPIPRGRWRMTEHHDSLGTVGPFVITLVPVGHNAHGRSEFRIHGNNRQNNASEGCIILSPIGPRRAIWNSGDHDLTVVR